MNLRWIQILIWSGFVLILPLSIHPAHGNFKTVSHNHFCKFQVELIQETPGPHYSTIEIKIVAFENKAKQQVYCSYQIGDRVQLRFKSPMNLTKGQVYEFHLTVSGGMSPTGPTESHQWSFRSIEAIPFEGSQQKKI